MTRLFGLAAIGLLVLGVAVTARDDRTPSIKDIMSKAHGSDDSLKGKITEALKEADTDWAAVTKDAKELVKLGEQLGKNTPKKGPEASWKKLTGEYTKNVKDLLAAAEKKNKADAKKAADAAFGMCGRCHGIHKGK